MKKIVMILAAVAAMVCSCDIVEFGTEKSDFDNNTFNITNPWLDLGLPSGTQWFCMNVGAKTPTEAGNFYAWGETETKTDYSWDTYKFWTGKVETSSATSYTDLHILTKYDDMYSHDYELEAEDDICNLKYGEKAHTPSVKDWRELFDNTTHEYKTVDGVDCIIFTSKINSMPITFPLAGFMDGTTHCTSTMNPRDFGPIAWLWTRSAKREDGMRPYMLYDEAVRVYFGEFFDIIYDNLDGTSEMHYGFNVRAVKSVK